MAFVYRYLHPDSDEIVYIGKTSGDLIESLKSRIAAHAAEYNFKKNAPRAGWKIEYLDGLTPSDADILETALINNCKSSVLFNKSKTGWGASSIVNLSSLEWKQWGQWKHPRHSPNSLPIVAQPGERVNLVSVEEYSTIKSITTQAAYKQIRQGKLNTVLLKKGKQAKQYILMSAVENAPFENHKLTGSCSDSVMPSSEHAIDALSKQLRDKNEQINRLNEQINRLNEQINRLNEQINRLLEVISRLLAEKSKYLGVEVAP